MTSPHTIETVKPGTEVYTYDQSSGEWTIAKVHNQRAYHYEGDIVTIQTDSTKIQSTVNHPFYILCGEQLSSRPLPQYLPEEDQEMIGPGRWGTCERHLGIPVEWSDINGARVIMEVDLEDFQVDHSQGSHFFHNISSAGIPYFYIKYNSETDFIDWDWLNNIPAHHETTFFRHVRTLSPIKVIADGKNRSGKVVKPE